jgi:hypothetical protein
MSGTTAKIVQWFLYALLAVSAVLGVLFYLNPASPDTLIYWAYALLGFGVVITILASVSALFVNPKGAVKFLIMLVILVVLAIIAYSISTNEFSELQLTTLKTTESTSKIVGAGLIFMYALAIIGILAIFYSSISRIFK